MCRPNGVVHLAKFLLFPVLVQLSLNKLIIGANMQGDHNENTQEGNNVFLIKVDFLQKLGHNLFGILVTCAKYPVSSSYYYMPRIFVQWVMMLGITEGKFQGYQRETDGLVL